MLANAGRRLFAFVFAGCALLLSSGVAAQLEVSEETGPYSFHVVGPNNLGDVAGFGPAGGTPEEFGHFVWYGDGTIGEVEGIAPKFINDNGTIAGLIYTGAPYYEQHAAILDDGVLTNLHLLLGLPDVNGSGSGVIGLTSTGLVAIAAYSYEGRRAFLWSEADGVTEIVLPSYAYAPDALNELGEVIGSCLYAEPDHYCAYYWSPATGYQEVFYADYFVYPVAINDRSEAVGYAFERDPDTGATTPLQWYWRVGEEAQVFATGLGQVIDVNNAGTVLGWEAARANGAYLWTAADGFVERNLKLPEATDNRRYHINDLGFVGGTAFQLFVGKKNFLWTPTYGFQVIDEELVGDIEGMSGLFMVAEGLTRYGITLPPATPVEAVEDVIEDIGALVDNGVLDAGEESSLVGKLNAATSLFSDDRITPACNTLDAFINQVEAKIRSGRIDPATGADLIAQVSSIEECSAE